jgi:hypothetical protein
LGVGRWKYLHNYRQGSVIFFRILVSCWLGADNTLCVSAPHFSAKCCYCNTTACHSVSQTSELELMTIDFWPKYYRCMSKRWTDTGNVCLDTETGGRQIFACWPPSPLPFVPQANRSRHNVTVRNDDDSSTFRHLRGASVGMGHDSVWRVIMHFRDCFLAHGVTDWILWLPWVAAEQTNTKGALVKSTIFALLLHRRSVP